MSRTVTEEVGLEIKRAVENISEVSSARMNIGLGGFTIVAYVTTPHMQLGDFYGNYDAKLVIDATVGLDRITVKLMNPDIFKNRSDVVDDEMIRLMQQEFRKLGVTQRLDYKEYAKWEVGHEMIFTDTREVIKIAQQMIECLGAAWQELEDAFIDLD